MTVTVRSNRVEYTAAAGQTLFPFDFRILSPEDLRVTRSGSDQILNSQYHVYGVGVEGGGYLVLTIACSAGEPIIIRRILPIDQPADYVPHDSFPADSHELQLDRGAMIDQQLQEQLNRCLQLNNVYSFGKGPLELPYPPDGQNRYVIAWNEAHSNLDTFLLTTQTGLVGDMVPSSPLAGFPAAGNAGRLRRATDNVGGLWVDHGTRWAQTAGQEQNAAELMVGDDATDNAAALTQLLANLPTGATLKIPVGTYRINAQLVDVLKSHITIKGDGMGRTYLHFTMPLPTPPIADLGEGGYALFKQTTPVNGVTFEDLSFLSNISVETVEAMPGGNVRGHNAVYIASANDITFRHCEIWNWGGRAFWIGNTTTAGARVRFDQCYAHDTWSDAFVAQNIDHVWFTHNFGQNIHPADSNHDGVYNSQYADFCHATASRNAHFIGNSCVNVCRIGYLCEGNFTAGIPSKNMLAVNNMAQSVGWGCPSGSGAAIWVENTIGFVSISNFNFEDVELGILVAAENNYFVETCLVSNGTISLRNHAKTAGKSDNLYTCVNLRAYHNYVSNVAFLQNGADHNGFSTFYVVGPANSQSHLSVDNCIFHLNPGSVFQTRAAFFINWPVASVSHTLSITNCLFYNLGTRLLAGTTGAIPGVKSFKFVNNHVYGASYSTVSASHYLIQFGDDILDTFDMINNYFEILAGAQFEAICRVDATRAISIKGNHCVSAGTLVAFVAISGFNTCLIEGNQIAGVFSGQTFSVQAGTTFGNRLARISNNLLIITGGGAAQQFSTFNILSLLYQGNISSGATTRALNLGGGTGAVICRDNIAGEPAVVSGLSSTHLVGRNYVGGVLQPAVSQDGSIPSGSTSVAITHNLPFTPGPADLHVIRRGIQPSNPVTHYWVSNITSTQFVVNCNADPGANGFNFSWQCVRH